MGHAPGWPMCVDFLATILHDFSNNLNENWCNFWAKPRAVARVALGARPPLCSIMINKDSIDPQKIHFELYIFC